MGKRERQKIKTLEGRIAALNDRIDQLEHPKDVDVEAHGNTWESMYREGPARISFVVGGEEVDVLEYLRNLTDRMETLEAAMFDLEDTAYSDGWEGWGVTMNNHEEILKALIDEAEGRTQCTDPACYLASPHQGECQPYVADNPNCVDHYGCIRHTDPDGHHLGKHRIWSDAHAMYVDVPTTLEIADSAITTEDLIPTGCPDCDAGIPKARGTTEYRYGWDANGMITFEEVPADKAGGPPTKTPDNTIPDAYTLLRNYVNDLYDRIDTTLTRHDTKLEDVLRNILDLLERVTTLETQQPNQPHIPPYTPTYPPPNTYPNPYQPPSGTGDPPPNTWYQTTNSTWPPEKETK